MQRLRIGIVGCGTVTQLMHLPSLVQLADQFDVTALCDVSPGALQGVGDRWNVPRRYRDERELLSRDDVDAVLVANPDAFHAGTALAAIAAGKHILIEKPMCLTLREADAIIVAQQRTGVTVQVGYMRRYAPAFLEARRRLSDLGEIRLARAHDILGGNHLFVRGTARVITANDVPPDAAAEPRYQKDRLITEAIGCDAQPDLRTAYAMLLGLGSHDLSAMRELLGRPIRVLYAAYRHAGMYLSAAFDYGDYVCHFEAGMDNIPRFDAHLEIYGPDRTLRVQYDTPYIRNLPVRLIVTESTNTGGVAERIELPAWGDPFVCEWQAFYENVTHRKTPKTSPADFRQDLELIGEMVAAMSE